MEITRLKWPADHPILPDLDIKLTDEVGKIYKTIIIVGDNGLGKTTILKSINDLISGRSYDFELFEYNIGNEKYVTTKKDRDHIKVKRSDGEYCDVQLSNRPDKSEFDFGEVGEMDEYSPQQFHSIISFASTDFLSYTGEDNEYDTIKQLLISLERQDNEQYRAINEGRESNGEPPISISQFNSQHSKLEQFKKAFNKIFDELKFDCVKSDIDFSRAIFTKGSNEVIEIDYLSTGEKQIVFRGSSILSKANTADIVLLDEPEISMHPRWLKKIIQYYQDLITDPVTNSQNSQLFITTHSDLLINKAIGRDDTLIIRLNKNGNSITSNKPDDMVLPFPTAAEINYVVFGICTIDYHIQLFSLLHSNIIAKDSSKYKITQVDASIKNQTQFNNTYAKRYENVHKDGSITVYDTLPCYVRNCINHPNSPDSSNRIQKITEPELEESIKFLRNLIIEQKAERYDYTK